MTSKKFLLLFHFPTNPPAARSPEETQAIYGQWMAWQSKFKAEIMAGGDGLKPNGKHLTEGVVTDGPYAESKDVIGSFTLLTTDSMERAVKIAQECPFLSSAAGVPGYRIEVREMAGY
jgi:hypothetical protein